LEAGGHVIDDEQRYTLSAAERAFYSDNGYVLVKSVFTRDEAAAFRAHAHATAERLERTGAPIVGEGWGSGAKVTDKPRALIGFHNVQFHASAFTRLIVDPRLTDRAADLIGPNVQLHHTKLFIKPPEKGAPFPMHQDVPYFPHSNHSMLAAIVHFDDAPVAKGCVRVVPGSHRLGEQEHLPDGLFHLPVDGFPVEGGTPVPAEAGDVLFFSYLTIHGSGMNESDEARTTLLVQMRDPEDLPLVDTHISRGQGMMLRGVDPLANAGPGVESPRRILVADGEGGSVSRTAAGPDTPRSAR
jgi:ectoine hydroxylase-related dioxygenase (phytanoyl-CoA dioxygenase family)